MGPWESLCTSDICDSRGELCSIVGYGISSVQELARLILETMIEDLNLET